MGRSIHQIRKGLELFVLRNRRVAAAALLVVVAVPFIALWLRHPAAIPHWPGCPSRVLVELHCPGCGSSRSLHHLLQLEPLGALRHNLMFVVVVLPVMLWTGVSLLLVIIRGRGIPPRAWPSWIGWALVAFVILFTVLRNLPGELAALLRPPP